MKVLYISHEGNLNGAPKSLLEFLPEIAKKGVDPLVVVPEKGRFYQALRKNNIRTEVIPYQQCLSLTKETFEDKVEYFESLMDAVISLCRLIRKEKVDLVHSNSIAVDVGAMAAFLCGKPHVWHLREYVEEDFNFQWRTHKLTIALLKKSACCISIADGIKEKYLKKYGIPTVRLYNGVNSENYYREVQTEKQEKQRTELLIAGAISENKGQWDAVRAAEILHKQGMNIHLNVIGDGNQTYVNKLRRYVRDHGLLDVVTFQKYTPNLQEIRCQSDIVLTCSKREAFGRVTAEAMMAGKIVIGANSGGTRDLIGEQEQRGYLYSFDCPQELADKIRYVIDHPEEKVQKEKEAQQFIVKLTSLDAYTDKLKGIYNKLLNK